MPTLRRSTRLASKKDEVEAVSLPPRKRQKISSNKTEAPAKRTTKKTTAKAKVKSDEKPKSETTQIETSVHAAEETTSQKLKNLKVGDKLPSKFTLSNQDGKSIDLAETASQSHVLIFFLYPRASTPGCTRQTKGFNENFEEYQSFTTDGKKITIFGLSADSEKAQLNFKKKLGLQFDLLSDPGRKLITILGANNSGKTTRSHFIFVDGKLAETAIKISPEQSISRSLEYVQEIVSGVSSSKEDSKSVAIKKSKNKKESKPAGKRNTRNKTVVELD